MITVLTGLHDLIHLSPFSAQRQKRKERRECIEELKKNEGKGRKTNGELEKVRRGRDTRRKNQINQECREGTKGRENEENKGERRRGKEESTWQPVTMQIHFKALLQKVGSDSVCCRGDGVLGGDLET